MILNMCKLLHKTAKTWQVTKKLKMYILSKDLDKVAWIQGSVTTIKNWQKV